MFVVTVDPIVFQIGPVQVSWTGLFVAIATIATVIWFSGQLVRNGFAFELGLDLALVVLLGGLVGARVFHVADHWSFYAVHPIEALTTGGASLDGGFLVGTLAAFAYLRRRKLSTPTVLDVLAEPAALALAIGSIGSFIAGDAPGRAAAIGPTVSYVRAGQSVGQSVGTYPAALYEALVFALVFVCLMRVDRIRIRRGVLQWLFLAAVGIEQLAAGFILDEPPDLFGLGQAQIVGVGLALVGLIAVGISMRVRGPRSRASG